MVARKWNENAIDTTQNLQMTKKDAKHQALTQFPYSSCLIVVLLVSDKHIADVSQRLEHALQQDHISIPTEQDSKYQTLSYDK
jgi:hypothetical protein